VKRLAYSQDYQLHLLVHQNIPYQLLEPYSVFTGDLQDFDLSWMEKYPPQIIFHLARMGGSSAISRRLSSWKGAKANERLIEFLKRLKNPPVVVYVSGSLMYGAQALGILADENSSLNPVSYARYYYRAEEPWLKAQSKGDLDVRLARPGWIIGPDSWLEAFYLQPFLRAGKIPQYGDGHQLMSVIHLEDCAAQIMNLAENGKKNQNLNVFSGPPVSQKDFAQMLAAHLNAEVETIPVPKLKRMVGQTVADALTASIPMTTIFPEMNIPHFFRYPDVASMIGAAVSLFENKKGVFPKAP
jgi:nucleoside-diphosphate-sugar epimerase